VPLLERSRTGRRFQAADLRRTASRPTTCGSGATRSSGCCGIPGWSRRCWRSGSATASSPDALQMILQGHWKYIGTELSENFRKSVGEHVPVEHRRGRRPGTAGGGYTRIIALDSLEHVRPGSPRRGVREDRCVAAKDCKLFIHYSHSQSHHDKEFDHAFGLEDLTASRRSAFRSGHSSAMSASTRTGRSTTCSP
jgi:hypothetical protein